MRKFSLPFLGVLLLGAALSWAGWRLYSSPQFRELLQPLPLQTPRPPSPELPQTDAPRQTEKRRAASRPTVPTPPENPEPSPGPPGEVLRGTELARTLIAILAAQGLADGISLEVNPTTLRVVGETTSQEKREAIIRILNKGRGARQLDADQLTVVPAPEGP